MEDERIVELYWRRDDAAVTKTRAPVQKVLSVSQASEKDTEEIANDAYIGTWNAILPAHRP